MATDRPSLNPVTIKGRQTAAPDAPAVQLTLGRLAVRGKPRDGQNRVGRDNQTEPTIVLTTYTGEGENIRITQTAVIPERSLIEALMLLFPDILVDRQSVAIANVRNLLFNTDRPAFNT